MEKEINKDVKEARENFPDYDKKNGIEQIIALAETRCKRQGRMMDFGNVMTNVLDDIGL